MDSLYYILWNHVDDVPEQPIRWSRLPQVGYRRVFGKLVSNTFTFEHNWKTYSFSFV